MIQDILDGKTTLENNFHYMKDGDLQMPIESNGDSPSTSSSSESRFKKFQKLKKSDDVVFSNKRLFLGGLNPRTTEKELTSLFGKYGIISDVVVVRCPNTLTSRRFGFISFSSSRVLDSVMAKYEPDNFLVDIDGNKVQLKRAIPVNCMQSPAVNKKKIFIGGISARIDESDLREYFSTFGPIESCTLLFNQVTKKHRGFGFVVFVDEDSTQKVLEMKFHFLVDTRLEVKLALPARHLKAERKIKSLFDDEGNYSRVFNDSNISFDQLIDLLKSMRSSLQ